MAPRDPHPLTPAPDLPGNNPCFQNGTATALAKIKADITEGGGC